MSSREAISAQMEPVVIIEHGPVARSFRWVGPNGRGVFFREFVVGAYTEIANHIVVAEDFVGPHGASNCKGRPHHDSM